MAPAGKLGFMDLPLETQKGIFSFVRKKDLLNAQYTSKSLHSLASARLYHDLKFTFVFPAEAYPTTISHRKSEYRLPEALHTFLTSDHDYAQYVRSFALLLPDFQTEENSRKAVSRYHVDEEANKLLNTTLLVMLRQTKKLEWDPSIELGGQVYHALSKIASLQRLHLRLDTKTVQRISNVAANPSAAPTGNTPLFGGPATTGATPSSLQTVVIKSSAQSQSRAIKSRHFSDFTGLRHLEILGMDDLGPNLEQIAACLTTCSGTLKSITLSLSQDLARRARKAVAKSAPPNPELGEETADDDDATVSDVAPPTAPAAPTNDAEARKEKAVQDSVLAALFGLEKRRKKAKRIDKALDTAASRHFSVDDTQHQLLEIISRAKKHLVDKPMDPLGTEATFDLSEILDNVSASYVNVTKKALSGKPKVLKSHKLSASGNKSKKLTASQQLALGALPPHLQNLSNDDFTLWAQQHANLLGEDYLDLAVNGPLSGGLPIHPSSSSYPQSTSNPFTFGSTSHTLPQHYSTSSKPTSMASSPYPYGPYSSSMVGISSANAHLPDYQMQIMLLEQQHKKQKLLLNKQKKDMQIAALEKKTAEIEGYVDALGNALPSSSEGSDTQSDTEEETLIPEETVFFPPGEASSKDKEDEMDIDMEHPDVIAHGIENDSDPDQEVVSECDSELSDPWTEASTKSKGKGKQVVSNGSITPKVKAKGKAPANGHLVLKIPPKGKGKKGLKSKAEKIKADEEDMQEYLRTTHGFHIEDFSLYLVPIKASTMAKALDLSFLKRLSLLGVGPQGGFWTLMGKIHAEAGTVKLQSIQTDDVSVAFLHAVSTFPPLENLYLMKRSSKDTDFSPTKNPASIDDIRVFALRRHLASLKRLVINNQDNNSWDLNETAVRLICSAGYKLLELGMSININEYHTLLQNLPGLSSLHALQVITLRSSDQCHAASRETRRFTLDALGHCPTLKIKHLVLHNQVLELQRKGARRTGARAAALGNSNSSSDGPIAKPADPWLTEVCDTLKKAMPSDRTDRLLEKILEADVGPATANGLGSSKEKAEEEGLAKRRAIEEAARRGNEVAVAKTVKFWDVEGVEMFGKRVRVGKL